MLMEFARDGFAVFGFFMTILLIVPKRAFPHEVEEFEEEEESDDYEQYDNGQAEKERQLWRATAKERQLSKQLKQTRKAKRTLEEQL